MTGRETTICANSLAATGPLQCTPRVHYRHPPPPPPCSPGSAVVGEVVAGVRCVVVTPVMWWSLLGSGGGGGGGEDHWLGVGGWMSLGKGGCISTEGHCLGVEWSLPGGGGSTEDGGCGDHCLGVCTHRWSLPGCLVDTAWMCGGHCLGVWWSLPGCVVVTVWVCGNHCLGV